MGIHQVFIIDKLANAMIETKNAFYIYKFAQNIFDFCYHIPMSKGRAPNIERVPIIEERVPIINKLAEGIIETQNAEYIFKFAWALSINSGIDIGKDSIINKLAEGIIETKDAKYIYEFARFAPNDLRDKLEFALEEIKRRKEEDSYKLVGQDNDTALNSNKESLQGILR